MCWCLSPLPTWRAVPWCIKPLHHGVDPLRTRWPLSFEPERLPRWRGPALGSAHAILLLLPVLEGARIQCADLRGNPSWNNAMLQLGLVQNGEISRENMMNSYEIKDHKKWCKPEVGILLTRDVQPILLRKNLGRWYSDPPQAWEVAVYSCDDVTVIGAWIGRYGWGRRWCELCQFQAEDSETHLLVEVDSGSISPILLLGGTNFGACFSLFWGDPLNSFNNW